LAAIYGPDLGHGFVRDDFAWIETSRIESSSDVIRLFTQQPGFYRPLVSLTFSADYELWHLNPFGYALTNLALFVLAAGLVFRLARTLALPAAAALFAVGVWTLDIHAPRMALLWISGRTALLLCVFALASADCALRQRYRTAGVLCLLALLSKEEAVLLPLVLTTFVAWDPRREGTITSTLARAWPLWAALAIYIPLRLNSGAFGPTNLPAHYPVVSGFRDFSHNAAEYAVRAGLFSALAGLVVTFVSRPCFPLVWFERRAIVFGALWAIGFMALTIFAANRSDLYALAPSIGCAFVAAALASCAMRAWPLRFRAAVTGMLVAAFTLVPLYWWRDQRWVAPADVSASVMKAVDTETTGPRGRIVLLDDESLRFGFGSAFDTLFPAAVRLLKGDGWSGDVRRGDCRTTASDAGVVAFTLENGRVTRCATARSDPFADENAK
jgi:hypothetical protein